MCYFFRFILFAMFNCINVVVEARTGRWVLRAGEKEGMACLGIGELRVCALMSRGSQEQTIRTCEEVCAQRRQRGKSGAMAGQLGRCGADVSLH